ADARVEAAPAGGVGCRSHCRHDRRRGCYVDAVEITMYEQYYGLRERPFDLSPDPRFLFLSKGHREALMHLRYGLTGRPGVTVLFGEAGTGKTTLVRAALQAAGGHNAMIVHLSNPTLTRLEFY